MTESSNSARNLIDLHATRVVVEGARTDQPSRPITYISCAFRLFFEPFSNTAFFRLRLLLVPKDNLFIYIYIYPEQVDSLSHDQSTSKNADLARLCGRSSAPGTTCLRLRLRTPGSIIGPLDWPMLLRKADASVLGHIQYLASQTALVVHIPQGALSGAQIRSLCVAVSSGLLTTSADHAAFSRLYDGRGCRVIQDFSATTTHESDESGAGPPSYDEVAGPSQPPPEPQSESGQPAPSKKRRLASPSPEAEADAEANVAVAERSVFLRDQMRVYIEGICGEMLSQRQAEFRNEVFAELGMMETRINANVNERMDSLKDDIVGRVEDGLEQAVSRDDLEDVIDDRVAGIKIEMEDFVKDEMRAVEDKMLDHFENGTWYGSFRRPDDT